MTTVYLVRHGQVEGNSGTRRTFAGWEDKPLTTMGERQAGAIARRLQSEPLRAVYASDLQRAARTGDSIAAAHGLAAQQDSALREVNYGEWERLSESEIEAGWADLWRARVADPYEVSPPGGESYRALWGRLQPAWERILAAHPDEAIALVGHNGSLRVLISYLLGAPLANARRLRVENCSLSRVEIAGGQAATVCYINDTCHLHNIEG